MTVTLALLTLLVLPGTGAAQDRVKVWEADITVGRQDGQIWIQRGWGTDCRPGRGDWMGTIHGGYMFSHAGADYRVGFVRLIETGPENENPSDGTSFHIGLRDAECAPDTPRAAPDGALVTITDGTGHRVEYLLADAEFGAGDEGRLYGFTSMQDLARLRLRPTSM